MPRHEVGRREALKEGRRSGRIADRVDLDVDLGRPLPEPGEGLLPWLREADPRAVRRLHGLVVDDRAGHSDHDVERGHDPAHRVALDPDDERRPVVDGFASLDRERERRRHDNRESSEHLGHRVAPRSKPRSTLPRSLEPPGLFARLCHREQWPGVDVVEGASRAGGLVGK
jgi:hypothetical protein